MSLSNPTLRTHMADFETTTAYLLRADEALSLLNFAALFNQISYITDTALGDHELLIKSFSEGSSGIFFHLSSLAQEGMLRVLCRDKVVVSGKQLFGSN